MITLPRDAALLDRALAVSRPLADGDGFSTDLAKAYAISDGRSRFRNGPFKVRAPNHCPTAVLSLHADEEALTLLGIEAVSGFAKIKDSKNGVRSPSCRSLLFPERMLADRMALPGFGSQPVYPLLLLKLLLRTWDSKNKCGYG